MRDKAWAVTKLAIAAGLTAVMVFHWSVDVRADVPAAVVEQFREDGGYVEYTDTVCLGADYDGTYNHSLHRIQVKNGAPENVLPHEYGHYVYHSTVNRWDAKHREKMAALYQYYKDIDRRCYTENECFAVLYSVYCTEATGGDLREMMEYATAMLIEGE